MKRAVLLSLFFCCSWAVFGFWTAFSLKANPSRDIRIGSKNFVESYLLTEIMAQLLEADGYKVERRHNLGGTLICYKALVNGQIDLYPEYSGTIQEVILRSVGALSLEDIRRQLEGRGLTVLQPYGFNNSYALAMRREKMKERQLVTISDLARWQGAPLEIALSYEFLERRDGWKALKKFYNIRQKATGIEHGLAYEGIASDQVDLIDVYSTDAEIERYDLTLLEDDRHFFPEYKALPIVRNDLPRRAKGVLDKITGILDLKEIRILNGKVSIEQNPYPQVAREWLISKGLIATTADEGSGQHSGSYAFESQFFARVVRHIELTVIALLLSTMLALPLSIFVYRNRWLARMVLYLAGLLQTVPSIALLALMIPLLGIGPLPAAVALILYAILPVLRAAITALQGIDPLLTDVADSLGLTPLQRLRYVDLPLSLPNIFAGIRTAAVISVGTATLAAFIGAGGLGDPIVTGLALNDPSLILEGAVPAALLAIIIDIGFDTLERFIVPRHLQRGQKRLR